MLYLKKTNAKLKAVTFYIAVIFVVKYKCKTSAKKNMDKALFCFPPAGVFYIATVLRCFLFFRLGFKLVWVQCIYEHHATIISQIRLYLMIN